MLNSVCKQPLQVFCIFLNQEAPVEKTSKIGLLQALHFGFPHIREMRSDGRRTSKKLVSGLITFRGAL